MFVRSIMGYHGTGVPEFHFLALLPPRAALPKALGAVEKQRFLAPIYRRFSY